MVNLLKFRDVAKYDEIESAKYGQVSGREAYQRYAAVASRKATASSVHAESGFDAGCCSNRPVTGSVSSRRKGLHVREMGFRGTFDSVQQHLANALPSAIGVHAIRVHIDAAETPYPSAGKFSFSTRLVVVIICLLWGYSRKIGRKHEVLSTIRRVP